MKVFVVFSALCAVAFGNVLPPRVPLFSRIVGGQEVKIEEYPYQVSVRIYDQHICGGSILDANTILTAGHCVYKMDYSEFSVRVGSTYHSLGQQVKVDTVRLHKRYNPNNIDYDVVILKLSSSLTFNDKAQPIELQGKDIEVPINSTAWVSGWGYTSEENHNVPDTLRAVDVEVVGNNVCIGRHGFGRITSRMFCAQTLDHDSCQGDSGGPLVTGGKQIGVVSWGIGCARPKYPGVYAKVSNTRIYDWIQENKY